MSYPLAIDPLIRVAIERFARDGFDASLRTIADDAGVSAALLIKRFGSKSALRQACDDAVLHNIRVIKEENIRIAAAGGLLEALVSNVDFEPLLAYTFQSVLSAGPAGKVFMDHMIEDAVVYMGAAVKEGIAHPSRDEAARVKYLVYSSVGALLLTMLLDQSGPKANATELLQRIRKEITPPMLEVYSRGVFTEKNIDDKYLLYLSDPPLRESEDPFVDESDSPHLAKPALQESDTRQGEYQDETH